MIFGHGLRIVIVAHLILLDMLKAQVSGLWDEEIMMPLPRLSLLHPLLRLVAVKVEWWMLGLINFTMLFLCLIRAYTGK